MSKQCAYRFHRSGVNLRSHGCSHASDDKRRSEPEEAHDWSKIEKIEKIGKIGKKNIITECNKV